MTERPAEARQDEWDAGALLAIVARKWWVVLIVFAGTLALALLQSSRPEETPRPVYEARTKLLIVAPVSERILSQSQGGERPVPGLSVETLSSLAAANDLMQVIITELDLRLADGEPMPVETLAGMISSEVETAGDGSKDPGAVLPLLTTVVRGDDPKLVAQIANKWAEAFAQKNEEIVALEAAGSYEFSVSQYESTQQELRQTQSERLAYQRAREDDRLASSQKRASERLAIEQSAGAERSDLVVARRDERLRLVGARQDLRLTTEAANPMPPLEARLAVLRETYADFLGQLEEKRAALVSAETGLAEAGKALEAEQPFVTLERHVSNDVLWTLLADRVGPGGVDSLKDLVVEDQERNDLYDTLRQQATDLQSEVSVLTAEIGHLETETDEQRQSIETLSATIGQATLDLAQFDAETERLLAEFDDETELQLRQFDSSNQLHLAQFDEETDRILSEFDGETGLRLSQFDQAIGVSQANLDRLVEGLQAAEIAKAERSGSIRVVEAAIEPSFSVGTPGSTTRNRTLPVGAGLGLLFGIAAALAVHALQTSVLRRAHD